MESSFIISQTDKEPITFKEFVIIVILVLSAIAVVLYGAGHFYKNEPVITNVNEFIARRTN